MDFRAITEDGYDTYKVRSRPRGYVLLINIENFDNGVRQRRLGSERDYEMLKDMWEDFGYEVKEYYDLNLKDFKAAINDFACMPEHANVDSAILFIMSHGKEDDNNPHAVRITTTDDQYVSSDWIKERFTSANCEYLINKPKIIFFQACRGTLRDQGFAMNMSPFMNAGLTMIGNKLVPVMTDLLLVYPTFPGYVSQRDTLFGAWFVQECISVFTNDSPHCDLLTMLNKCQELLMGRRKSNRKPPPKRKAIVPLDTQFDCPFCNHEKSCEVIMDKARQCAKIICRVCLEDYQTVTNFLSEPVDVYNDWIDACDKTN